MSRRIDLSKPLTDDERQYLADRSDFVSLERNAAQTMGEQFVPEKKEPEEIPYEDMTVAQLHEVLKEKGLPVSGTKDELLARLLESQSE